MAEVAFYQLRTTALESALRFRTGERDDDAI